MMMKYSRKINRIGWARGWEKSRWNELGGGGGKGEEREERREAGEGRDHHKGGVNNLGVKEEKGCLFVSYGK